MQKEMIQDFTRRIVAENRSGLTIVTYDIFFASLSEAEEAWEKKDWDVYKQAVRRAVKAVSELIDTLNFSYDLARELYRIYVYCKELLSIAMARRGIDELKEADKLMHKLYLGFQEAAKSDTSGPLMKNTEQVFAGYTYGRDDVVENSLELNESRGFRV